MPECHDPSGESHGAEPIAIVGMGCRLPGGVASPTAFWDLLTARREVSSQLPPDRWADYATDPANTAAMRDTVRRGSFLDDIAGFDAGFFGILPREAEVMDPQQRILLEVTWEALEDAGIVPSALAGTDASVYIGVVSDDYARRLLDDLPQLEAWTGIGTQMCGMANRISYALDLRGASMAIDTACSASLVALHLAARALAAGETSLAVVGGANVIAGPGLTVMLDAAGALAPDGRCKPFDATADGYGRGEGAGVLVLKRLSDAVRDNDPIRAVLSGSAVHQEGRTNGILAPSEDGQVHLLRSAYRHTPFAPSTVDYVETHGTGTPAGDPMEAGSLSRVLGESRPAGAPCLIGSVKGNIGHLEGAAGVVSVIKAVLALERAEIPATRIATTLTTAIPWEDNGLRVVTEPTPWPSTGHPRRAAVSGNGYGGTIAHVVLEQAPEVTVAPAPATGDEQPRVFPLSAATEPGLRANAAALARWLEADTDTPLPAIGHTLAARREHLEARAAIVAGDRAELVRRLRSLSNGERADGVTTGSPVVPGMTWVFSGHGSQWAGMGRELLASEPAFAAAIDELAEVFLAEIGFTPRSALESDPLEAVDVIQPMIFAVQLGLAATWREYGFEPTAVIGSSVGEVAAAVVAGALSSGDGARLICRRSLLLRRVAGAGAMAMANLSFAAAQSKLDGQDDVVAAISSAQRWSVVSGTPGAVHSFVDRWRSEGIDVRIVDSDVAFHSPQMDPLLAELSAAGHDLTPREPKIPLYTTALDDPRAAAAHDGAYWAANLRNPVRFAEAILAAAEDGHRGFLELSGHPVVVHSIADTLDEAGVTDVFVTGTLRRNTDEQQTLLTQVGALHCHGVPGDFARLFPHRRLAALPTTSWQHRRYWRAAAPRAIADRFHDIESHTLLGSPTTVLGATRVRLWQTSLDFAGRPYAGSHSVHGVEIVPAAVLLHTFDAAARAAGNRFPVLSQVDMRAPISLAAPRDLQVTLHHYTLRLASKIAAEHDEDSWLTHTTALVDTASGAVPPLDVAGLAERCPESLPGDHIPELLASLAVPAMGFPWRVEELRRSAGNELYAVVASGPGKPSWASLLDAALTLPTAVFAGEPTLRMPARIGRFTVLAEPVPQAVVHVAIADPRSPETVTVTITDLGGEVLAVFDELRYAVPEGTHDDEAVVPAAEGHTDHTWAEFSADELAAFVTEEVRQLVAHETKLPHDEVKLRKPLVEQGLDSVMTLILRRGLEKTFQTALPSTLLWNYPTVTAIAGYLTEQLAPAGAA
jgi:acyl transferase domain-containing protein/acyl carrier protein